MNAKEDKNEDLLKCPVCGVYFKKNEGFTCPKCKRGPLCKSHRVPGRRECASCVVDTEIKELNVLKGQERSIKSLIRLLQFIFLLFSIFFISLKSGLADTVDILQNNVINDNLIYIGIVTVAGYLIFYLILYNQRKKIIDLESRIKKPEIRRQNIQ